MPWEESLAKLQEALRAEVTKRWGRIGEIEEKMSLWSGALSDFYAGRVPCRLDFLLKILDALEIDHGTFFRQVLGGLPNTEDVLAELEVDEQDRSFDRIAQATRKLQTAEPPPADPVADAGAAEVGELARVSGREQGRRLRSTRRYRTQEFARAYLEHLDALRYDQATVAAKRAVVVAAHLVPKLPGPRQQRIALQCRALGVFGSARRIKGHFTSASRAFRLALELARREGLRQETARLLQRASYLLRDFGHFDTGLLLLREALEIYVDLDSRSGVGMTLVDRGMMLCCLGELESAVVVLERALSYLDLSERDLVRNHLSAYQNMAYAYEHLGDLESAERSLETGVRKFGSEYLVDRAKLQWLQATLAFKRGDYARSAALLRSASAVLADTENAIQGAVIMIDLVAALLAQGIHHEASELARDMARLLKSFRSNRHAEVAIVQLVRAGIEGSLSQDLLEQARQALQAEQASRSVGNRRT